MTVALNIGRRVRADASRRNEIGLSICLAATALQLSGASKIMQGWSRPHCLVTSVCGLSFLLQKVLDKCAKAH